MLRPGGYIMWTMEDALAQECPDQFAHFDPRIVDLVEQVMQDPMNCILIQSSCMTSIMLSSGPLQRRWELLVGPVYFEKFRANRPGRFYMMRKCYRRDQSRCSELIPQFSRSPCREVFARGSTHTTPAGSPMLYRRRGSMK